MSRLKPRPTKRVNDWLEHFRWSAPSKVRRKAKPCLSAQFPTIYNDRCKGGFRDRLISDQRTTTMSEDPLKPIKQKLQEEINTLEHELNVEHPKKEKKKKERRKQPPRARVERRTTKGNRGRARARRSFGERGV